MLSSVSNPINKEYLNNCLVELDNIRIQKPNWGLPELLMPSFEEIMKKSAQSFKKIMPKLFHEFGEQEECGILLCKGNISLVYGFGDDKLYLWYFSEQDGRSVFNFYSCNEFIGNQLRIEIYNPLYVDKKKVINLTGQEVIVMDSKWFRKIVNDNDIYVRGFWRMQNKKNENGEWYKELIFVDSFVRHGYHRNAKIEQI